MIDRAQYGAAAGHPALRGRRLQTGGAYPFGQGRVHVLHVPGGEVVAAASGRVACASTA